MILSVNNVFQLIFVTVKCGVFYEVRTGFLNVMYTKFGFKGLTYFYFSREYFSFLTALSEYLTARYFSVKKL
jgi:hypothetical protein